MSGKIKYLLFDAANTLIHKPVLWQKILDVLKAHGYEISIEKLMYNHKFLSEIIHFPDRTNSGFYMHFNRELLYSLGINPDDGLLNEMFEKCSYLEWQPFEDCSVLSNYKLPKAILSNFKSNLSEIIQTTTNVTFDLIINSETEKIRKPSPDFFMLAIKKLAVKPSEILYIGDSIKLDYEPSVYTGMNALVIDRINFYPKQSFIINSFNEINRYLAQ